MADKSISELVAATSIGSTDLFVLEQTGTAKKLTGQILENWLVSYADGHGGIQSLTKTSSTGTNPVIDTYTITYADATTSTFTVTNGLKGDKGDQTYVWIKYAAQYPIADSQMSDSPDDWIGIYVGLASTAPTHYTDYTWFQWKGNTGETGASAAITTQGVTYLESASGTIVPSGSWSAEIPSVSPGNYLWTRTILSFNDGTTVTSYSVSRFGIDGTGAISTVNGVSPDGSGNVTVTASNIQTSNNMSVQSILSGVVLQSDVVTVSANGSTTHALTGLTANHVIGNWGMFSDAACTTPIPENAPTCDITITTSANSWDMTIANFSATFYIKPTFVLKQN